MSDLPEFLLARFADDEAVAVAAVVRNGATWSTADLSDGTRITGATEFGNPRSYRGDAQLWDDEGAMGMFTETATHVVRHDPARVLAECDAKRRIVDAYRDERSRRDVYQRDDAMVVEDEKQRTSRRSSAARTRGLEIALELLALPYADHPDYREEWRS